MNTHTTKNGLSNKWKVACGSVAIIGAMTGGVAIATYWKQDGNTIIMLAGGAILAVSILLQSMALPIGTEEE